MVQFTESPPFRAMFCRFLSGLSLGLLLLLTLQIASATEYIDSKPMYNWANLNWNPKGGELKAAIIADCRKTYGSSSTCTFEYGPEEWVGTDSNWEKWHWSGTLVASYTSGGVPKTTTRSGHFGSIYNYCPTNARWSLNPTTPICYRDTSVEPDCDQCKRNAPSAAQPPSVGNPIFPSTGVKSEVRVDYLNQKGTLRFVWTYRSDRNTWSHNYQVAVLDLKSPSASEQAPAGTCYTGIDGYCHRYRAINATNDIAVFRNSQRLRYFSSGNQFSTAADIKDRLMPITAIDGTPNGWSVKNGDTEAIEVYDLTGRIVTSTEINGRQTTYTYSDLTTPPGVAPKPGLLLTVTDAFGATLNFAYDSEGRVAAMTDPSGGKYTYAYLNGMLSSVGYPDGKHVSYLYNEPGFATPAMPRALTGIVDENGSRFATFTYNAYAAKSTEHAGSVNKYVLSQSSANAVTDPLGAVRTYMFNTTSLGVMRYTGVTQPNPAGSGSVTSRIAYDANGNVASVTDFAGVNTTYVYDMTRNLEIRRTEASGTTAVRTISTEWHPTWDLPLRIAEPKKLTTNTYDDRGNLLTQTVKSTTDANGSSGFAATASGASSTWTYTYDTLGQMLTVKGPRVDVNDLTSYLYDEHGNLTSVTDALGHTTTMSNYDANGRVGKIIDPNGLVTDLTYTPRGWLASRSVGGQNTSFTYDGTGQLTELSFPDNSKITYSYDGAHRLTGIADSLGNSISYTLDAAGNRTAEVVKDVNGVLTRQTTKIYNALSLLKSQTGGAQ